MMRRRRLPRRGYFQRVRIVSITRPRGRGGKMYVLARSGGSRRRRRIRNSIGNVVCGRFYNEGEWRKSHTFFTGHSIGTDEKGKWPLSGRHRGRNGRIDDR